MAKMTLKQLVGINSRMELDVGDRELAPNEGRMIRDPQYVWRTDLVRDMLAFWTLRERCMMLTGPKGSGKTTLPEQWHAILRHPLWTLGGHKGLTADDLFGQYLPNEKGGLTWQDGPLIRAARIGGSVLINEVNAIDPRVSIILNDIAQTGSIVTIPQTGEAIIPAEGFRIFLTANPAGTIYAGRQELDSSTRERPYHVSVPFMERDEEIKHVVSRLLDAGAPADTAGDFASKMVQVAEAVRATSMEVSSRADAIPETLSTRVLAKWARYWVALQAQPSAVHRGLERALTTSCSKPVRDAIHAHVTTIFGVPVEQQRPVPSRVMATA
jgi:cobaltochelatase CobS